MSDENKFIVSNSLICSICGMELALGRTPLGRRIVEHPQTVASYDNVLMCPNSGKIFKAPTIGLERL